jgi:CO/xanthine dehydrogenase FAD-binding subunit
LRQAAGVGCARADELVTEIEIPIIEGAVMHYDKFRLRESVDFAIVGLATVLAQENGKITGARIVFGGVAPIPLRINELEGFLLGKEINAQTAREAGEIAVKYALPMEKNTYKLHEMKIMLSRALLRLA